MATPAAASGPSAAALSEWLDAARVGLWSPLADMLARQVVDVNAQDQLGMSALLVCAEEGHDECVEKLVRAGAKIDQTDASGCTALMYAAESGALGCVRLLLAAGSSDEDEDEGQAVVGELDLNAQDSLGETAAHKAARAQEAACLGAILDYEEQRCDLEIVDEAGNTALLAACASAQDSSLETVALLLAHGRNRSRPNAHNRRTGRGALHAAVHDSKIHLLQLLCGTKGVDLDRQDNEGTTALMQCIIDELPVAFLTELLRHKASVSLQNHRGYTALHMAVRDGSAELVSALLAHGGDSARQACAALDAEFGWTPLMHAAAKGQKDIVRLMGEAGVDVNVQDKRGSTALLLASRFGSLSCAKYLVKHGASLCLSDRSGHGPLSEAGAGAHLEVVRFLSGKGAPLGGVDARGSSVLHRLCARTALPPAAADVARFVLQGGDGKGKGEGGGEAAPSPEVVHALLHGLNADGETCWSLARLHGHQSLVSLFSAVAASLPPPPPQVTSVAPAGEDGLLVTFKPALNATFMLADLTYEATAVPVLPAEEEGESTPAAALAEKKVVKKSSTKKPAASATAAGTAAAGVVKIAEPKKSASVKKSAASASSSSSSSSSSAAAAAASASKKKVVASSSSKRDRETVVAGPVAQSVRGLLSPLRVGGLHPGTHYRVVLVARNGAGASAEARWDGTGTGTGPASRGVLVGTPPPPMITQVATGSNWASVSFMPGGSSSGSGSGSGAGSVASASASAAGAGVSGDKSAVEEFILTATASVSASGASSRPGSSAPAPLSSPSSSAPPSSSSMDRVVSAVSSPVLLTGLAPGLTYSLSIRARNGFGVGAPSTQGKVFSVTGAPPSAAVAAVSAASASSGRPSSASASASSSAAEKHVVWLNASLDAAELAECRSILTSALSAELQGLLKAARPATAHAASRPSTATARGHGGHPGRDPSSSELRIVRAAKIANHALQSAFDAAPSFMQAVGCSRTEAARTQSAFVALERGPRGMAQLSAFAAQGLLPFAHPLSPSFQPVAAAAAAAASSAASTSAADEPSYNRNTFPVGSPYRGVYVALHVGRKMLLASGGGGAPATAAVGDEPDDADVQRLLIFNVLPGRTRAPNDAAATAAVAGAAAVPAVPAHAQSTRFDSHQSPSGSDLFLYSPAQAMPAYFVEFVLPLTAANSNAGGAVLSAAELQRAVEAVQLERDAAEQSGLVQSEAAPLREDPLGADRTVAGFGASKWMGSAPASAAEPPGELSAADQAARNAVPAAAAGQSAYSGRAGASAMDDDDDDGDEPARIDINKVQSSLLGPAPKASAKPAAAAISRR